MFMEHKTLLRFATDSIIFQCTDSFLEVTRVLEMVKNLWFSFFKKYSFLLLYTRYSFLLYRRNQDVLDPYEQICC